MSEIIVEILSKNIFVFTCVSYPLLNFSIYFIHSLMNELYKVHSFWKFQWNPINTWYGNVKKNGIVFCLFFFGRGVDFGFFFFSFVFFTRRKCAWFLRGVPHIFIRQSVCIFISFVLSIIIIIILLNFFNFPCLLSTCKYFLTLCLSYPAPT